MEETFNHFAFLFGIFGLIVLVTVPILFFVDLFKKKPKPLNQFDAGRQAANFEILKILIDYTAKYPTQRFGQILRNTGLLVDVGVRDSSKPEWETPDFYIDRMLIHEEPQRILERMKKELAEQNKR